MTRWRRASIRLDCGCEYPVNPAYEYEPLSEAKCEKHGPTHIIRWGRVGAM